MKEKLLLTLIIVILASLGFWQLSRLSEKTTLISNINRALASDYIDLDETKTDLHDLKKVRVKGKFDYDKTIFLYAPARQDGVKTGNFVLVPLKTKNHGFILVNRGWTKDTLAEFKEKIKNKPEIEQVEGILMPEEKKRRFLPANKQESDIWFYISTSEASKRHNINLGEVYIYEQGDNGGYPKIYPFKLKILNDHLGYAITWFSLALAAWLMYYFRKYIR